MYVLIELSVIIDYLVEIILYILEDEFLVVVRLVFFGVRKCLLFFLMGIYSLVGFEVVIKLLSI